MTSRPTVSVIVPAYNGASFVPEAIRSIFSQTYSPQEIIVVDDCSTDETRAVVEELASRAPVPVQVHSTARNSGSPAATINLGVDRARGEMIAVLEQDDTFLPHKLEKQCSALARHPTAIMAFGLCNRLGSERIGSRSQSPVVIASLKSIAEPIEDGEYLLPGPKLLEQIVWHGSVFSGFPGFVFRREAWKAVGGVSTRWRIGSDLHFVAALLRRGPAIFLPEPHYCRRFHRGNLSTNGLCAHADVLEIFDEILTRDRDLCRAEQTTVAVHRYVTYAGWYAAYGGNLVDGFRLWNVARRAFGFRKRTLPDAAMLLLLRSMIAIGHPRRMTADVRRVVQAAESLRKKLKQ